MALSLATKSDPAQFKSALNKLATDQAFRANVMKNPEALTEQFPLSIQQLRALRQAAILSGVDLKEIDKVRSAELRRGLGSVGVKFWDIDISCCCCCCCGETAVITAHV